MSFMSYLLDTDIIVYWLNNNYPSIQNKIENVADEQIFISSITVVELFFGAYNSSKVSENIKLLEELTSEIKSDTPPIYRKAVIFTPYFFLFLVNFYFPPSIYLKTTSF